MSATTHVSRLLALMLVVSFLSLPTSPITQVQMVTDAIPAADEPLSIILMIGDGMGFEHVELGRLVEVGEFGSLNLHDSEWNASVTTYSADAAVTDSAAAATAISTGTKTNNRYVALNPSLVPLETILEYAQTQNKSTGVVATSHLAHATPASFMTHVTDRGDYTEIARQIVDNANVDVLFGGGTSYFTGAQITTMASNGYSVVYNRTALATVTSGRVFGLFASDHMDYEYDRDYSLQPSIAEMTNKSIELLSQDADGFFLLVEGSKIDLAAHNDDKVRNALDTIAFDNAVDVAMDYVKDHNNTILIVTADHETEGLVILSHNLNSELPADFVSETDKRTLRAERANNVTVDWTATYHTAQDVPFFAFGDAFLDLTEDLTIDNTDIYKLMKDFYLGNPLNETELTTTTTTTTTPTTETTSTTDTTSTITPTETTSETSSTTSTTGPTSTPGVPLDSSLLLAISAGAAIIILVALVLIKRR
jgi:alkaline phosphatase